MRHETRVWFLPLLLALLVGVVAFVPSRKRAPEPVPVEVHAVPEEARGAYQGWVVMTWALPPPFSMAGWDPRPLLISRLPRSVRTNLRRVR